MNTSYKIILVSLTCLAIPSFPTMAEETKPIAIVIAAGDIANCYSSRSRFKETAVLVSNEIEKANNVDIPIRVLVLGDVAYRVKSKGIVHRSYDDCLEAFDRTWGKFKSHILPVPGNHDYSDDTLEDAGTYFQYFSDFYDSLPEKSENGSYHYVFPEDHPNGWSFFGYNFYRNRSLELEYATQVLSQHDLGCVLAFTHPFHFSSGHHGQKLMGMTYDRLGDFHEMLVENHASLFLTAHDHHFEQFGRVESSGKLDKNSGVRYFVVGTGGAPLYANSSDARHKASQYYQNSTHGVLKISLFADSYKWEFIGIDNGETIDAPEGEDFCNRP